MGKINMPFAECSTQQLLTLRLQRNDRLAKVGGRQNRGRLWNHANQRNTQQLLNILQAQALVSARAFRVCSIEATKRSG